MSDTLHAPPHPVASARPSRNPVRIVGGVAMLVSVPLFLGGALSSPPQRSSSDESYLISLGRDAGRTALSADLFHYGWVASVLGAIAVLGLVTTGKGRVLTTVGALVGIVGSVQISGLLLSDYFNGANARLLGTDQAVAVFQDVQNTGSVGIWFMTSLLALVGTPVMLAGLARAGRAPWHLVPLAVVGPIVPFFLTGTAGLGLSALGYVPAVWVGLMLLGRAPGKFGAARQ